MTEAVFLKILNMALSAGYLVLAVLVLRLVLRRAPRWVHCVLWGLVGVRLVCPFTLESVVSLIPSREVVSPTIMTSPAPQIQSGVPLVDGSLNPVIGQTMAPDPIASVNPMQVVVAIAAYVWVAGALVMLAVALVSYWRLRRRVAEATPLRDNIFQCANLPTTFILGMFKPRIYVSYAISEEDLPLVLAHEQSHLCRRDHWIKPLAYLLLSVYWFHPLVWVGYALLCRDIELACDEKVMRTLGSDTRRAYATALLHNGTHSRRIAACPLAFGEVGVKERVKSVMHYKKPTFWIVLTAVVACTVVAVCFLTSPKTAPTVIDCATLDEDITIRVTELELEGDDPHVTVRWKNKSKEDVWLSGVTSLEYEGASQTADTAYPALSFREHPLEAGASSTETYDLRNYTFVKAGTYRLELRYSYPMLDAFETAWITFTVPKEAVEPPPPAPREMSLVPHGEGDTFTQVTDSAFLAKNGYHVYYYGVDSVDVWLKNELVDLKTALLDGRVTVNNLTAQPKGDGEFVYERSVLRDGGTVVHSFGNYAVIQQHSLDGERHVFIGSNMTVEMLENFSPAGVRVDTLSLSVQQSGEKTLRCLTDYGYRTAHGFDVYTYGLESVQVQTEEGLRDWQPLLLDGTVTAEELMGDASRRDVLGEVRFEPLKNDSGRLFDCGEYVLIQLYGESGRGNVFVGSPDITEEDIDNVISPSMSADVTGDGVAETVRLQTIGGEVYNLEFANADGEVVWREEFSTPHVGWNSLYLCATDEGNYLLRYNPYANTGLGFYRYCLFRPENGQEAVKAKRELEFDLNGRRAFDVPEMVAFADEVNALLKNSVLLFSTDWNVVGEPRFGPLPGEQFLETYDFLDDFDEDIYAKGDDLATRLQKFSDYMMASPPL